MQTLVRTSYQVLSTPPFSMPETKPYYQARFSSSASTALYSRALASTSSSITKSAPYCTVSPLPPLFTLSKPILQVKYGRIYLPSSFLAVLV